MPVWLTWAIVIVVVVALVAVALTLTRKRRTTAHRARAEGLRQEAATQAAGLGESHRQADELRAKADLAKAEADRAEERAQGAEQAHQVEQAGYEDKLRVADRLDPDVDTTSDDYEPDVWHDGDEAATATDIRAQHRAD